MRRVRWVIVALLLGAHTAVVQTPPPVQVGSGVRIWHQCAPTCQPRLVPGRVPSDGWLSEESRPASDWVLRNVVGWLLQGRSGFDERTMPRESR